MLRDTQDDVQSEDPLQEALQQAADETEERLRAQLQARRDRRNPHPLSASKRCYKCREYGHIRAQCPNYRRPWNTRV
jgi:hypothetical protein